MCVMLICPPKVRPDLATLEACSEANPHGGGIALREDGSIHYRKIDYPVEISRLARRAKGGVIHFRIASVGGVQPELRHPFSVTSRAGLMERGHSRAVLFQNGTWAGWRAAVAKASSGWAPGTRWSDERHPGRGVARAPIPRRLPRRPHAVPVGSLRSSGNHDPRGMENPGRNTVLQPALVLRGHGAPPAHPNAYQPRSQRQERRS